MVRFINIASVLLVLLLVSVAAAQGSTASIDLSGLATQTTADISGVFATMLPVMIAATALLVAWKYAKRIGRSV
jgi:uncharacterized membrane protein YciS (DUF1049 family)